MLNNGRKHRLSNKESRKRIIGTRLKRQSTAQRGVRYFFPHGGCKIAGYIIAIIQPPWR